MSYSGPDLEETFEMFKRFLNDYEENRDKIAELEDKLRCRRCGHKCHTYAKVWNGMEEVLEPAQCREQIGGICTQQCSCEICRCPLCIVDRLPEWKKGR